MHISIDQEKSTGGARPNRVLGQTPAGASRPSPRVRRRHPRLADPLSAGRKAECHAIGNDARLELDVSDLAPRRLAALARRSHTSAHPVSSDNRVHGFGGASSLSVRSLAEQRGYDRATLMGLAEVGHHYIRSGGFDLARLIFEGLSAVQPSEAYFVLARAYLAERQGDRARAIDLYGEALRLAPSDPCPEVNLAELALAEGDLQRARLHFAEGRRKARDRGDAALLAKADALLGRLAAVRPGLKNAEAQP